MNGANGWRPDWRQAQPYIGLRDWRWEFLRRNPQYLADWEKQIAPFYDIADHSLGDGDDADFRRTYDLLFPAHPSLEGPMTWGKDVLAGWPFWTECGERKHKATFELEHFTLALLFDLTRDIDHQVDRIAPALKRMQSDLVRSGKISKPRASKNHRSLYPIYLRALDAESAGASLADMAAVLFPNHRGDARHAARDALARAKEMRDSDYTHIR